MIDKKVFISQIIVVLALIVITIYILFHDMYMVEGSMTREEINSSIQELTQITNSDESEPNRILRC